MKKIILSLATIAMLASCGSTKKVFPPGSSSIGNTVTVYNTAQNTNNRLTKIAPATFKPMPQPLENQVSIFVDPTKQFQNYVGIGGAITDAAAETFYKMPLAKQQQILTAYFDKDKGIGYNIVRTNINSCDFSSSSYTYVQDGDKTLETFNIAPDRRYKLPMIKAAQEKAGKLMFYASPWSPPAYMKDNNNMLRGGKLKKEYYDSWAMYYTKFIKAYEAEGVPVWGLSIQNEPMATQTWESCIYTAEEERDFLKNHLGPTLAKEGLGSKKIIAWDHNRDMIYQRAQTYLNDPEAAKYIWGIGYHWYEDWSGGTPMFDNLRRVYEAFPGVNLFFTEGCKEKFDAAKYNWWLLGEKYATNMINDFNNGNTGFTDWNILLDETGGPNHVGNFCFAPIHGDTKTGEVHYTNAYYYIGHFSKFLQPGAKRIAVAASRSQLQATGFKNPDGSNVVVVMNDSDKDTNYFLWIKGNAVELSAQAHSISTIIF